MIPSNKFAEVAAASGLGMGAFWDDAVGKKALEFGMPTNGDYGVPSGIILAPTPAVWSMFAWRWEALESKSSYQLSARVYAGFVLFSDGGGTPADRYGSGNEDPGFQGNAIVSRAQSFAYNRQSDMAFLVQNNNETNRPIEILSTGEIVLYNRNDGGAGAAYAKGVLTVGPEVILPAAP